MPYVTDDDLLAAVAAHLHTAAADLLTDGRVDWSEVVAEANLAAAADIDSILLGRGYTAAQVLAWTHLRAYALDQGLYRALTRGVRESDGYQGDWVDRLDRRKDLAALTLVIGGAAVPPGTPSVGAAGGRISEDGYRINSCTEM